MSPDDKRITIVVCDPSRDSDLVVTVNVGSARARCRRLDAGKSGPARHRSPAGPPAKMSKLDVEAHLSQLCY